jgi:energy-coupling factor transporter ATP-binding protein EcfA2
METALPGDDGVASPSEAPSIWSLLDSWSKSLLPWQRYVITKAVRCRRLTDDQVETAFQYFLYGSKLRDTPPDGVDVEAIEARPLEALTGELLLTEVANVSGVNALPAGTGVTFGSKLTLIYGRNGAGKSGYVRLLANACFCRYRPDILPDIYAEVKQAPSATFKLTLDGQPLDPVQFSIGADDPRLKRFTVFDSAVARHLLTQQMPFEFKPAGFDVFPEVVRVYNRLEHKLDNAIAHRAKANTFPNAFIGGVTAASNAVSTLGPITDLGKLRELGRFGEAEKARVAEIDKLLVALRGQSSKEALETLAEAVADIKRLRTAVTGAARHFTQEAVAERKRLIGCAVQTAVVAATMGLDQFKRSFFKAVGSPEWESFVAAAHLLAQKEHLDFPKEADRCLLCEQPLSDEARAHMAALFAFIEGDVIKTAEMAKQATDEEFEALDALVVDQFSETSRVRTHVKRLAPPVADEVETTFEAFALAKSCAQGDLAGLVITEQPLPVPPVLQSLDALLERLEHDKERLSADDTASSIADLETERRGLRHQEVLSKQLAQIEQYVSDAKWCSKAMAAKGTLGQRAVTDKEKEFFAIVVGDGYRERFAQECAVLRCDIPVEMQTMGREGRTVRTMAMRGGHKTTAILSEGEQRAIALADFLTEVAENAAIAGIILDDPVTSQDHQRMKMIATRLVTEANNRQVVVFTHDLPFLNAMFVAAEAQGVSVEPHWIDRRSGKPGYVAPGDAPVTMKAYESTDKAKKHLAAAKVAVGSKQVEEVRAGMGALRRTIEETVVKRLFKDAVPRWSDQVRVTTLRQINWDNDEVEKICGLFEDLSRYIEGHSHSDEAMGSPPEVVDLETRVAQVDAMIKWARAQRPKAA